MKDSIIGLSLALTICACSVTNPSNQCNIDTDCQEAEVCTEGQCASVCDPPCAPGVACDAEQRACATACSTGADCGPNEICVNERCVASSACTSDTECPGEQQCFDGQCTTDECQVTADCPGAQVCIDGACTDTESCTVGTSRCNSNTVIECQEDGEILETPCDEGWICLEANASAACHALVCEAGESTCLDEDTLQVCDRTGTALTTEDCAVGEVCDEGICGPRPCEPFAIGCADESTAFVCDREGNIELLPCREDQFCEDALCRDRACAPGQSACVGDTIVTCNDAGTMEQREFCADDPACQRTPGGCACQELACVPRACVPRSRRCVANAAQRCAPDGTTWQDREECGEAQSCVAGSCVDTGCEEGDSRCSGETQLRCEDGRWVETDCTLFSKICIEAVCTEPLCQPGAPICADGDVATRCNFRGDGVEAGTDCGDRGQICLEGSCLTPCAPLSRRCVGDNVEVCGEDGLTLETIPCGDSATCREGACVTQLCEPGQPACNGSRATVCDETGLGYLQGGTDCQQQDERCQRGACVDTPNQCPTTVAMAGAAQAQVPFREGFIVAPASAHITLDGSASQDDSSVARVRWTLLGSPRGVQIRETGDPQVATASGLSPYEEYLFQAVAIDNEQEESCQPETVRVYTVGDETLVFHLLWDNELDNDPFDERGSDVDIHLLKARRGTWFDRETDCHWGAPAPDWGPERPRQIIDDTNGRGPEIIVLDNPEPCNWYALAVHYFETEGFGSALAHLHVFQQGRLTLETRNHPLADRGAWWEPAIIHWESGRLFSVDRTFPTPQNGSRPTFSEEALASELCGIPGDLDD